MDFIDLIPLIPVHPFHPRRKRRWVLRRALFHRLGIILGFFTTGMNWPPNRPCLVFPIAGSDLV
jgi:hypothetical protein